MWQGYHPRALYWDVIDTPRRIVLCAMVLFIDPPRGSDRLMRLVVGTITSACYAAALGLMRPFKRHEDSLLAMLICS